VQTASQAEYSLEERRKALAQIVDEYGTDKGLLGEYQLPKRAWLWLKDRDLKCRSQCLFLLITPAQQEIASIGETPQTRQDVRSLEYAACFYEWATSAACGLFSGLSSHNGDEALDANSEQYLLKSLHCYHLLQNVENASTLYRHYAKQRRLRNDAWEPSQAIKDVWPTVTRRVSSRSKQTPTSIEKK
jgi:hypothetical protein